MKEPSTDHHRRLTKIALLAIAIALIAAFFELRFDRYLSMTSLKEHEVWMHEFFKAHPVQTVLAYFAGTVLFVVCALPAAAVVMLLAGALFGPFLGTLICSLAVSIGAVLSLLSSRFLFRDFVRRRFAKSAALVEREYGRNGFHFLIAMRLIPVIPYFITNLVFGLTEISASRFWFTSLFSSLPAIAIYANAGSELSKINELGDIFNFKILLAFIALAALPFLGRFITQRMRIK